MGVDEEPKIQSASGSLPKDSESMAKSTERKEGGAMQGNSLQRPQAQSLQRNFTPHPPRGLTLQQSTDRTVTQQPAMKWGGTGQGRIEHSAQFLMQSAASGKVGNGNPGSQLRTYSASISGHIAPSRGDDWKANASDECQASSPCSREPSGPQDREKFARAYVIFGNGKPGYPRSSHTSWSRKYQGWNPIRSPDSHQHQCYGQSWINRHIKPTACAR